MYFDRDWTIFALDTEVEHYGTKRICDAHNKLRSELEAVKKETIVLLKWIQEETPVDFLGTGSNLSAADKIEREWFKRISDMIDKLEGV